MSPTPTDAELTPAPTAEAPYVVDVNYDDRLAHAEHLPRREPWLSQGPTPLGNDPKNTVVMEEPGDDETGPDGLGTAEAEIPEGWAGEIPTADDISDYDEGEPA